MINVVIADDHEMFRKGIKSILETTSGIRIIQEARDGSELIQILSGKERVHVLLLDISMPGRSGLDLITEIHTVRRDLPIIILSMHEEEQYAVRAFKTGCKGYIAKSSPPEELIDAIKRVSMGEKYVSSKVAGNLADYISREPGSKPHENLSNREYEVFCMIAKGIPLSKIGDSLNLSVKTVSTYKTRVCEKLGLKNDAELTRYAIENNLV
ncbi:MAG: response regulator transcription factor [Spirochaetales bacterium]|nr:response regulator transcription factor [Spirochaetales bacterium]